ncbi:MAG: sugar phosphate nucleotidyltransferase [Clostridiales bacterium]|nr:sugar phosphate nucleotidyltransferase [Clostridiales bacterium]
MDTTLVVMAAGMGSRFGGLKQMEPIGPGGEVLLDFSVYDAKKSGFNKVVFIIKEEIEKDFKEMVGKRISNIIDVEYVLQDMSSLPEGRKKPWGTSHAILCCKDVVKEPFAVINADDYYGANAFTDIQKHLSSAEGFDWCMVSYDLDKTLSENGTVARGCCKIEDGYLKDVVERTKIDSSARYTEDGETWIQLPMDQKVSMNLWGFTPDIFGELDRQFNEFLRTADLSKDECLIPKLVDRMIKSGKATVKVFSNKDKWYGITYHEDKEGVCRAIKELCDKGLYRGI